MRLSEPANPHLKRKYGQFTLLAAMTAYLMEAKSEINRVLAGFV